MAFVEQQRFPTLAQNMQILQGQRQLIPLTGSLGQGIPTTPSGLQSARTPVAGQILSQSAPPESIPLTAGAPEEGGPITPRSPTGETGTTGAQTVNLGTTEGVPSRTGEFRLSFGPGDTGAGITSSFQRSKGQAQKDIQELFQAFQTQAGDHKIFDPARIQNDLRLLQDNVTTNDQQAMDDLRTLLASTYKGPTGILDPTFSASAQVPGIQNEIQDIGIFSDLLRTGRGVQAGLQSSDFGLTPGEARAEAGRVVSTPGYKENIIEAGKNLPDLQSIIDESQKVAEARKKEEADIASSTQANIQTAREKLQSNLETRIADAKALQEDAKKNYELWLKTGDPTFWERIPRSELGFEPAAIQEEMPPLLRQQAEDKYNAILNDKQFDAIKDVPPLRVPLLLKGAATTGPDTGAFGRGQRPLGNFGPPGVASFGGPGDIAGAEFIGPTAAMEDQVMTYLGTQGFNYDQAMKLTPLFVQRQILLEENFAPDRPGENYSDVFPLWGDEGLTPKEMAFISPNLKDYIIAPAPAGVPTREQMATPEELNFYNDLSTLLGSEDILTLTTTPFKPALIGFDTPKYEEDIKRDLARVRAESEKLRDFRKRQIGKASISKYLPATSKDVPLLGKTWTPQIVPDWTPPEKWSD